jgi:hypothetical protein
MTPRLFSRIVFDRKNNIRIENRDSRDDPDNAAGKDWREGAINNLSNFIQLCMTTLDCDDEDEVK